MCRLRSSVVVSVSRRVSLVWKSFAPRLGFEGQPTLATDQEQLKTEIRIYEARSCTM